MAKTKQTARKSTGGQAPRQLRPWGHRFATCEIACQKCLLSLKRVPFKKRPLNLKDKILKIQKKLERVKANLDKDASDWSEMLARQTAERDLAKRNFEEEPESRDAKQDLGLCEQGIKALEEQIEETESEFIAFEKAGQKALKALKALEVNDRTKPGLEWSDEWSEESSDEPTEDESLNEHQSD